MNNFLEFDEIQKFRRSVVVGNEVLNGVYTMSLLEYKFLYGALHQLQSTVDLSKKQVINKLELKKFMKIEHKSDKDLLKIIKDFCRRSLSFENENCCYVSAWVWEVNFHKGDNEIEILFNKTVIPQLIGLKSNFTQCDVVVLSGAKCSYTERLYPMLKQYLKIGSRQFTFEELVKKFVLPKSYTSFSNFNNFVIKKSIADINRLSDIRVKVRYVKESRSIVAFNFIITEKPQATVTVETTAKEAVKDSILKEIAKWADDVELDMIINLQQDDESTEQFEERLKDALDYCKNYKSQINGKGRFLYSAILKSYRKKGVAANIFTSEIKEEVRQEQEKKMAICGNCEQPEIENQKGNEDFLCDRKGKVYNYQIADWLPCPYCVEGLKK